MSFLEVLFAELKRIFSDVAIVLTIIGGVILYSFLYPQPYAKQSVSELSISVVDKDRSDISREIIYKLDATPQVSIVRQDMSEHDAQKALERGDVKGIVVIPSHFTKDLALGISPTIAVGADSSYFLIYGAVLEGAMKSVLTQAAQIKVANLLKAEVPISSAKEAFAAYSIESINLFNKDNSYTEYVVPAVFILILQQTMLIGLGILGGGINESIRREEDGYYFHTKTSYIIFARMLIFGILFFIHMLFYFGFIYESFQINHIADIGALLSFGVLFLVASLSLGIFLGALFRSREIATPAILFSSLPLVFSVGFIWPLEMIPDFIRYLSYLSPSTPAIQGFLELNQMGASLDMLSKNSLILLTQIVFYIIFGYYILNKNRGKNE